MKIKRRGGALILGAVATLMTAAPAFAAEILTLSATEGRFLAAGFYPDYVVFLKGLDPSAIETRWVDKKYMAVLDVHEGPDAGQTAVMELVPDTDASPNPQWCKTEGGTQASGRGITCLEGDPGTEELRFRVRAHYIDALPAAFSDRQNVVEFPSLPGRRPGEELGKFDLHILIE